MLFIILIVFLLVWLLGSHVGYNRWGYGGGISIGGLILLIFVLWLLFGGFSYLGTVPHVLR